MKDRLLFIVDDDPLITDLVKKRLGGEGFRIRSFTYGEDCIEALRESPDAVILDFYFVRSGSAPMNGMEVLQEIRRIYPDLPVIMLSAQDNGELVLELARKGIDGYVIKDNNLIGNLISYLKELFNR